ncbi:hypothetical protein [Microbacterium sp. PA5]|uniref:hypothetical protein n=1 Tax=Microbacterium sp. PA5 TaxID=3416654 RepID=UPI003CEE7866
MSDATRPVQVGDRFATKDNRDAGRVIEVVEALPTDSKISSTRRERAMRLFNAWGGNADEHEEWLRKRETRFRVRTEAHPLNPSAVGNVSSMHEGTLAAKYRRISR